jgi:hypothetical protein
MGCRRMGFALGEWGTPFRIEWMGFRLWAAHPFDSRMGCRLGSAFPLEGRMGFESFPLEGQMGFDC